MSSLSRRPRFDNFPPLTRETALATLGAVPVFGLGISDLYTTYNFLLPITSWIQKNTGIAIPLFHGRWGTPLPYKTPIKVLIGNPIDVPINTSRDTKIADPKLVDELHAKYILAVKELHKTHGGGRKLTIV